MILIALADAKGVHSSCHPVMLPPFIASTRTRTILQHRSAVGGQSRSRLQSELNSPRNDFPVMKHFVRWVIRLLRCVYFGGPVDSIVRRLHLVVVEGDDMTICNECGESMEEPTNISIDQRSPCPSCYSKAAFIK